MEFSALRTATLAVALCVPTMGMAQVRAVTRAGSGISYVPTSGTDEVGKVRASGQAIHSYLGQGIDSTASAFAYGDLATGKIGASSSSNGYGQASSGVHLNERLSFYVPGAAPTKSTLITFNLSIEGFQGASFSPTSASVSFFQYGFQAGQDMDTRYYQAGYYALNGSLSNSGFLSTPSIGSWSNYNFLSADGQGSGTLTLEIFGERPSVSISSYLTTYTMYDGFVDYSHTASLNLSTPMGVSWTSASGAFLSQVGSVPEPSTWAMMIGGFGIVGGAMRRRKFCMRAKFV
jgi:hypothetical protein